MEDASLLRLALRLNSAYSSVAGIAAVVFASRIAPALDAPHLLIGTLGVGLVLYGAALAVLSVARRVAGPWAVGATALDIAWVMGSGAVLTLHDVPRPEIVWLLALGVLVCAVLQAAGLYRGMFEGRRGRFELAREVAAPAERAWAIMSDVAKYAEVAGTLHRSEIVSGAGLGLVRRCEDKSGACWTEVCTRWDVGSAYAFEVDTSAPSYPLPLEALRGDFEVDPIADARCRIRVRFTFTARGGLVTEMGLALAFAATGDVLVGGILRRWATQIERTARAASLREASAA